MMIEDRGTSVFMIASLVACVAALVGIIIYAHVAAHGPCVDGDASIVTTTIGKIATTQIVCPNVAHVRHGMQCVCEVRP